MELSDRLDWLYRKVLPRGVGFLKDRGSADRPPSASWATPEETLQPDQLWRPGSFLLGTYNGRLIGSSDNRHHFLLSGSRGGKTSTVLEPNLLTYPGSMLIIDPKGELAAKTAAHRRDVLKQDVFVLDPFDVASVRPDLRAQFNPLTEIDPNSPDAIDDAAMLADAMILDTTGSSDGSYWTMAARNFVRGMILYAMCEENPANRTLNQVSAYMYRFEDAPAGYGTELTRNGLFRAMMEHKGFEGVIGGTGASMLAKVDKEAASVLSSTTEQLAFLDSPALNTCLAASSFRLRDLARKPTTIYLCLNAGRMATHFRWLRLIIDLAIVQLEREAKVRPVAEGSGHRIMFVLEEMASLQHMKRLEIAAGLLAGTGVGIKMVFVFQDLGQLKALYRDRWQTFLGNSGVIQAFSLNDLDSLKYVSERLGNTSYWASSYSQPSHAQRLEGQSPQTWSMQNAPLLDPAELASLVERDSFRQVVIMEGKAPRILYRVRHETVDKIRAGEIGFEP